MIYSWKQPTHVRGKLDAQVVGDRLESLRVENGQLTAEITVADARPEKAPLHAAFEWDDATAAEQFRLEQARLLIRSVVYVPEGAEEDQTVRAFVVVNEVGGDQAYTSTYVAMSDPQLRQQVVARALRELRQIQAKYREIQELAAVFAAIDEVDAA